MKRKNKSLKKKVKFSFKRMLAYVATYLVCTFSVASLVVLSNNNSYSSNSPILFEEEEPSTLGLLVSNLMALKDLTLNIDASIKNGENELKVNVNGDVVIYDGFSNVDLDLTGNLAYNEKEYSGSVSYKDGKVYLGLGSETYSFNTSSLTSAFGVIMAMAGVGDMQDAMGAFDMSLVYSLEEMITEEALDNGVKLLFAITNDLKLEILTDEKYNLKSVTLADYNYNGYVINASISLPNTNTGLIVTPPETHSDITPAFNLLNSVINSAQKEGANFELEYDDFNVCGSVNFNEKALKLNTEIMGLNTSVYYKDDCVYLDAPVLKLKSYTSDIMDLIRPQLSELNNEETLVKVLGLLSGMLNNNALSGITFESITESNNNILLNLNDVKVLVNVENELINYVKVLVNNELITLNLNYAYNSFTVPEFDYINVFDLSALVNPITNLATANGFDGDLALHINGFNTNLHVKTQYSPLRVEVSGNVLGANINVTYLNDYFYVSFNDSNIKLHMNSLNELVDFIKDQTKTETEESKENTTQTIIDAVNKIFSYVKMIKSEETYVFSFENFVSAVTVTNNDLLKVNLKYEDLNANLLINYLNPEFKEINESEFELVEITKENLTTLKNNLVKDNYNFNVNFEVENQTYNVSVKLGLENGLLLNASTNLFGYNINVMLQENVVYINFDGIKVKGNLNELPEIIENLVSELTGTPAVSALSAPVVKEKLFNITDLLGLIDLSKINYSNNTISLDLSTLIDGGVININFKDNNLNNITFTSNDVTANIVNEIVTVENAVKPLTNAEVKEYGCDISGLANLVSAVNNSLKYDGIMISSATKINGNMAYVDVRLNKGESFNLYASVNYKNQTFKITYINDVIYLSAFNLKLKFDVNSVDEFVKVLGGLMGAELDINALDLTELLKDFETKKITSLISNIYNEDAATYIDLTNGLSFVIYNGDLLNGLNVYYKDYWISNRLSFYNSVKIPSLNAKDYADVTTLLTKVNNTKDVLLGKFNGTLTLNYNNTKYSIDYLCDNTNGFKFYTDITVLEKVVSLYFENNTIYIAFDGYKMMMEVKDYKDIINWLNITFGLNIKIDTNINFDLSEENILNIIYYVVNEIQLTENQISLAYENYNVNLTLGDYLTNVVLADGENKVELSINKNPELEMPELALNEYNDWTLTSGIIEKVIKLFNQGEYNFNLTVTYDGVDYTANVQLDLVNNGVKISTVVYGYDLVVNFEGNMAYIDFNGLKLKDSFENLASSATQLMDLFGVKLPDTSGLTDGLTDINLASILGSLKLNSFSEGNGYVSLSIEDVLCLKEKLNITDELLVKLTLWHGEENIEKIDIENQYANVQATLITEKTSAMLSTEEKEAYLTNVSDLVSYVERLYNSYNNVKTENGYAISGKIAVRYSKLQLEGNLSLNVIDNNIYAHISSTAFGINTNIYLVNDRVYVDVAGLKITLQLNENDINNIINWVNENFNQNITFEFSDEMTDLEMPSFENIFFNLSENVFGVGLSEYALGGNLNTKFENLLLDLLFESELLNTINITTNVLDNNTTVYENGYSEWAFDWEDEVSKMKNLVLRLNELSFGDSAQNSVWGFNEGVLTTINSEKLSVYNDYENVLEMIEWVFNYYKEGKFNLDANVSLFEKVENSTRPVFKLENGKVYSTLELDENYDPINGMFYAGGNLIEYDYETEGNPATTHSISAYYDNEAFWGSYTHDKKVFNGNATTGKNEKSLKIKIGKDSIREILSIVLHLFAVDLGSFESTLGIPECNLDVSNLQEMLGIKPDNFTGEVSSKVDELLSNLNSIIGLIDNINLTVDGDISIFSVGIKLNDSVLNVNIGFENQTLSYISATDIAVNDTQTLNFNLSVSNNEDIPTYEKSSDHIDLTHASSLLKALINTSTLDDYHISGQIALTLSEIKAAKIGVDVQVKNIDGKSVVAIELSNYPLIGFVNGENTNGVGAIGGSTLNRERKITIYIKDGYAYLRTVDEKWGAYKEYTRATKITVDTLFSQIEYYIQYLLGFESYIQEEINTAINTAKNREYPINICNIINSFVYSNGWYNISVNLSELAYSNDIGTMNIQLNTINNSSTNNLDYLYQMGLDISLLDMMYLKTDNENNEYLELVDIGKSLDFTSVLSYISNYGYAEDVEIEKKGSDSFSTTNSATTSVTFVMNNGSANVVNSGATGNAITFPTSTYVYDDGNVKRVYSLENWYEDEGLTIPFTKTTYSRFNNYTVYAKWNLVSEKYYYTYTLNYNNGTSAQTFKLLEGNYLSVNNLNDYVIDNGVTKVSYYFNGWYLDANYSVPFTYTVMPSENIKLFAKWNSVTEYYYTLNYVENGGEELANVTQLQGSNITLHTFTERKVIEDNKTSYFEFRGWYLTPDFTGNSVTSVTLNGNINVYAKWECVKVEETRKVTLMHNSDLLAEYSFKVGEQIVLSHSSIKAGAKFYLDSGFNNVYVLGAMPSENLVLYLRNCYTITFDANGGNAVSSITVYEGDTLSLPSTTKATTGVYKGYNFWEVNYSWEITTYTFAGWFDANGVSYTTMPDKDITLVAKWNASTTTTKVGYSTHKDYQKLYE